MPDVVVAGAGMAGLCAAAQARALGGDVVVYEKGNRAGGSMLLSSGVIWRHSSWDDFRAECPGGDPLLQRAIFDELDESLAWLESLGAAVSVAQTGNPKTTGRRFDTGSLTRALVTAAGDVRLSEPLRELPEEVPVILATGGFAADRALVAQHITPWADDLVLRSNPWSCGDGLRLGLSAGGSLSAGMDEFYGRAMPAPPASIEPSQFVGSAQLYARHATVRNERGETFRTRTWSEIDAVQWIARQPHARATYSVAPEHLHEKVRDMTVAAMITRAEDAGARVRRNPDGVHVEVAAGITTTLGGLAVGPDGRVSGRLYAAGADAGGIAGGGYVSGLAAALVLGRRAARSALRDLT